MIELLLFNFQDFLGFSFLGFGFDFQEKKNEYNYIPVCCLILLGSFPFLFRLAIL